MRRIFQSLLAISLLGPVAAAPAPAPPEGITRTPLQRHDLLIGDREAIQMRVDIAPGAALPWHRHPGVELVYIVEGVTTFELRGQPPVTLKAGDVFFIPAGTDHRASNQGTARATVLATYIVEKGKPLLAPSDAGVDR